MPRGCAAKEPYFLIIIIHRFRRKFKGRLGNKDMIPYEECEQCGAKYYSDSVMEKLEKITSEAKTQMQELTVTDYSRVA